MKRTLPLVCFMLVLCSSGLAGSQDLPPEILADLYLLEATEALENGEPQQAIRAVGKIEALDTDPPLEFLFFYGKILVEHGTAVDDFRKGQALLKQFILNIEKDADQYVPTLKLLSAAGKRIEKAEREAKEAEAELSEVTSQMVRVPGGMFMMGCTEEQHGCEDSEKSVHRVQVQSFEISKYEVTQDLWETVMGENPSSFSNCAQCPVESVSWEDIQTFLEKLSTLIGERYRLPTEAEWEYSARGSQQSRRHEYAGSDTPALVAWYTGNSESRTHPVGQKAANELGLYDMSGNVWEWVADCWNESYHGAPSDGSAWTSGDCSRRVLRGGSWLNKPEYLRSAFRYRSVTGIQSLNIGFRLARTLTP